MKLLVPFVDLRGGYSTDVGGYFDVIDQETGKKVGFLHASRSPRARYLSLFGGKYCADFDGHPECVAFAKGVELVLNHLIDATEATDQCMGDEFVSIAPVYGYTG